MDRIVSLSSPDLDWEVLAQTVETAGEPLWLELGGVIRGVILPRESARRLMGQYVQARADRLSNPLIALDPAEPAAVVAE